MTNWLPLFILCFIISTTLSIIFYQQYSYLEVKNKLILNDENITTEEKYLQITALDIEKENIYIPFFISIIFVVGSLICIFIHSYFSHLFSGLERIFNNKQ